MTCSTGAQCYLLRSPASIIQTAFEFTIPSFQGQHFILWTYQHSPVRKVSQSAAALCSIAATAGRLAFRNVLMCRTANGIFSGTSFHGYMLT